LQALKILVVVLGVMIVVGFTAVIVAIASRVSHRRPEAAAGHPLPTAPIEIPRGSRVEAMTATPDRLILDLVSPDGDREIMLIDLATGTRIGTIELHSQR
jgi:hypothetical protein